MKISGPNYVAEHAATRKSETEAGLIDGLSKLGAFRGGLGDLGAAIGRTGVSIDSLLTIGALRKLAESEGGRGFEILFHDGDRDIEVRRVQE